MPLQGIRVPPLSRKDIQIMTERVRSSIKWDDPWFPVVQFLEFGLPKIFPGFLFDVLSKSEMGDNHGATIPERNLIQIREDVFEGAFSGKGRDRMTIAHEIGHYFLHRDLPILTKKMPQGGSHKPFLDSEWQASCFAGELLIPVTLRGQRLVAQDISEKCGVSLDAANVTLRTWERS